MTIPLVPNSPFVDDVSIISADTANQWRANMAKALDGVGGSVGVPSTPATAIEIGGAAGLELTCPFVLATGSAPSVESGVTVDFLSGSILSIRSGADIARAGAETLSGVDATTAWRTGVTTDASETRDVTHDELRIPETLGGLRVYTLRHSTSPIPGAGMRIRFSRNGVAITNSCRIVREDATILATFGVTSFAFCEVCYMVVPGDATARWRVVAAGGDITVNNVV